MADSYKNIIITPNRGATANPNIEYRGGNSTANTIITMSVYPDSNGTLSFDGSAGQLFSITNDLSNVLWSVNDISGIPSAEIFANGDVRFAEFNGNVSIGTSNNSSKLFVQGNAYINGPLTSNGNVTANFFIGNGSQLTGIILSSIANGNSNVSIPAANGNVNISAVGNANILVVTGTGANIAGTLNATGNANVGNIGATRGVFTNIAGEGGNISNIQGGNVSGAVASATSATNASALLQNTSAATTVYPTFTTSSANGNSSAVISTGISANLANNSITATTFVGALSGAATTAGTVTTAAQPNITSVGTLTSLAVTGNANVGNLNASTRIYGNDNIIVGSTGGEGGQLVLGYVGVNNITGQANGTWNMDVDSSNNFRLFSQNATGVVSAITMAAYSSNNNVAFAGNVSAGFFIGNGSQLTGIVASAGASIINGNSNVNIPAANGNVNTSVGGVANVMVVSSNTVTAPIFAATDNGNGTNFRVGDDAWIGDINTADTITIRGQQSALNGYIVFGNNDSTAKLGRAGSGPLTYTGAMTVSANITSPQLISNVATGTAPFVVTSTTQVANLSVATAGTATSATNASALLQNTSTATTVYPTFTTSSANGNSSAVISTGISANLANNAITATTFVGALSGAATSATNAAAVQTNASTTTTVYPTFVTAATNANYSLNTVSGISANLANNAITATTFVGALSGAATTAGTVTTAAQPNITSVGTLTSLNASDAISITVISNNNFSTGFNVYKRGNTGNTNGPVVSGAELGYHGFYGYDGTAFGRGAYAIAQTTEDWTATAHGTKYAISTTPNGATAGIVRFTVEQNGNISIGGNLSVTSNANVGNIGATRGVFTNIAGEGGNISNIQGANVSGAVASATSATNASALLQNTSTATTVYPTFTTSSANGNSSAVINTGISANLGNASITATTFVGALSGAATSATTAGTVTTAAQPNITSVGTLTSVTVTGNVAAGNLTTTGVLSVTGTGVSSIAGNLDMTSNNIINLATPVNSTDAATKQYVDDVAQGLNIHDSVAAATPTTLATITTGTITYNNGSSGVGANLTTTGTFNLIDGVNVQTAGTRILVKNEANAVHNGIYTWSNATVITRATDYDSVPEVEAGDFVFVTGGTLYDNTGWVQTDSVTAIGAAGNTINFAQFSGAGTYQAGTGLTLTGSTFSVNASQTQITSVGTLGTLTVTGNASAGNLNTAGAVVASTLTSNIATGTAPLTVTSTTRVANLNVATAGTADSATNASALLQNTSTATTVYPTFSTSSANGNSSAVINTGISANLGNASITATTFVGALSGAATSATTAGTVTTNAQPNITSVGTLTSLGVNGTVTAVAFTANTGVFTGNGNGLSSIVGANVTGTVASATSATNASALLQNTSTATTVYPTFSTSSANGNSSAVINTGISANLGNASITATTFVGALSGAATSATSATNAAAVQTNASTTTTVYPTFVTAATNANYALNTVSGISANLANNAITATTFVGSLSGAATTAGTVTTNAQPNITSVGTLTSLGVNGTVTAVAFTANTGVFTGNGNGLSSIVGANVTGTVASATSATNASALLQNTSSATTVYPTFSTSSANGNSSAVINTGISANLGNASITATTFVGALSGAATSATTAGTVTTNAQPNITSVGTLTGLTVGNATANTIFGNGTINATGNANVGNIGTATAIISVGNITTINSGLMQNGNSAVSITANGNVTVNAVGGTRFTATATGANVTGTLDVSGNANVGNLGTAQVLATANVTAPQLISNVAQGTAPLVVTSNTLVTNLNADLLDGATSATANTASTIALRDANGNISANFFIGNGSQLTGITASAGFPIANGTSNINAPAVNGNINLSVAGNANILVATGTGVNVAGTLNATGNANVGNLGTAQVLATANVTAPQLISNIATGTAPMTVQSITKVANLNADLLDGFDTATANTASTIAVRDANGNISANFFIGNGSQLTGITASGGASISNGTSNVNIATSGGNVTTSVAGNANILVVTGTGANIAGTLGVTGNTTSDNIFANANLFTPGISTTATNGNLTFDPNGTGFAVFTSTTPVVIANGTTQTTAGLQLTGDPLATTNDFGLLHIGNASLTFNDTNIISVMTANANSYTQMILQNQSTGTLASSDLVVNNDSPQGATVYGDFGINGTGFTGGGPFGGANTVYMYASSSNLSVGTLGSFPLNLATANTTRITIDAGGNTNVTGNLNATTINSGLMQNGNSNVTITANGNVTINAVGGARITATSTGANVTGTLGVSGVASVGANSTINSIVIGYRDIPQNLQNAAYGFVLADAGKSVGKDNATAYTYTIPANSNVAFPTGTAITIFNGNATSNITIAITTDTLRLAGTTTTGSRTLAPWGLATAIKIASTTWLINGSGLT